MRRAGGLRTPWAIPHHPAEEAPERQIDADPLPLRPVIDVEGTAETSPVLHDLDDARAEAFGNEGVGIEKTRTLPLAADAPSFRTRPTLCSCSRTTDVRRPRRTLSSVAGSQTSSLKAGIAR